MSSSKCANCGKCYKDSKAVLKKSDEPVIALLGQPNSGKSSIFNMMTGSHQHVGNWPGKTVERKEGIFTYNGSKYILADLPGSYSLTAGSDEEVVTKEYIESENADLVLIMADASQLRRSLYMLADFVGNKKPAILILNMIDVAKDMGISVDTDKLSKKLGIKVVPMTAINKKSYQPLYEAIEETLEKEYHLEKDGFYSPDEKIAWIDELLLDVYEKSKSKQKSYTKFDKIATTRIGGKIIAVGVFLLIFLVSMIFAGIVSGACGSAISVLSDCLKTLFTRLGVATILVSLICDVLLNVLYFATMMASFVLGINFGFTMLEEIGYLARVSFVFDHMMSKVGLQGKAIMPFFMGFGCTIAGATGTRVVDNWGQRVLAIAMSWAVPCAATLSVMPTIAITLFGTGGGFLVMLGILAFMLVMMILVYVIFGKKLAPKAERSGLIMELPPYHKPNVRYVLYTTFSRTLDIFLRALKVISLVSIVFFILSCSFTGNAGDSVLCKVGMAIEHVTKLFGLSWQAFMAFLASAISKESLLGVLNTLYSSGGDLISATFNAKIAGASSDVASIIASNFTKAEGLAFIFACSFNMPCVSALAATAKEAHSIKWTAKIAVFYTVAALLISFIVYHIGLIIF